MRTNAISIANYFVDLANADNREIRLLGLIKRVYIVHGFTLAILNRPAIDERFDKVEAWRLGPVIPSVYHSFKHFTNQPVSEKSVILTDVNNFIIPEIDDKDIKNITKAVWKRYYKWGDMDLVNLLHRDGTPWSFCYVEGKNEKIPDIYTKIYYKNVLDDIEAKNN
ncbi:MAG: DUF4065 domain-containing protein [Prevotellaceae bacterium]|jgi:uncharacterized phage-associated protein|nr:DUF4065 domain-containing protein [Prevotellaceae bacterium]